jgi:Zn-finger nucleic acid-binding protein
MPLSARDLAGARVDECTSCGGVFVHGDVLETWLQDDAAHKEVTEAFPSGETQLHPGGAMYVKCPRCGVLMNRKMFALGSAVVVDVCRLHGTWFDAAELGKVVEFAASGGMARAAAKEAERQAEADRAVRATMARLPFEVPEAASRRRENTAIGKFLGVLADLLGLSR